MLKNALAGGEELTDGQGAGKAGLQRAAGKLRPFVFTQRPLLRSCPTGGPGTAQPDRSATGHRESVSAQLLLLPGKSSSSPKPFLIFA